MIQNNPKNQLSAEISLAFLDWAARRFTPKRYQPGGIGNWSGHLPFAYDLIISLKPDVVVELGTHYGESYFGICQAVEETAIPTRCYAVDTWRGDEHAGFYSEAVYQEVDEYNRAQYGTFSSLLRMPFDEAASQFRDGSIDLLHIDGLHTYEAVSHDFSNWLPRVKPGGVILLHDVMVRSSGFGVWRLWEELTHRFPTFTFHHSWGLGVLRIPGPPIPDDALINWLFDSEAVAQQALRRHYFVLAESLEHRCGTRAHRSAKESVCAKLYSFGDAGYSENQSQSAVLPVKQWKHISFELSEGMGCGPIRFDPGDAPAFIEIGEIKVRRAEDGQVLWHAAEGIGFDAIEVNREIQVLSRSDHFRCVSNGFDPQIFFPRIPDAPPKQALYVEISLTTDGDLTLTLPEQLLASESRVRELVADWERSKADLLSVQQRHSEQIHQLLASQSQLQRLPAESERSRVDLLSVQQRHSEQIHQLLASENRLQELAAQSERYQVDLLSVQNRQAELADEQLANKNRLLDLVERLGRAEDEIRNQRDAQKRFGLLLEGLRNNLENGQLVQDRMSGDLVRQRNEIRVVSARVEDILRSRIWRTLVRLGGLVLRFRKSSPSGRPSFTLEIPPAITPSEPQRPQNPPAQAPSESQRPAEPSTPPVLLASASRHAPGTMSTHEWNKLIGSIATSTTARKPKEACISIITPVWNTHVRWFAEAAISVLEQTCADWEWCIVDDGSTQVDFHALFPVLESTGRVKIQRLDSNRGISYATNSALRMASCDYVCFLDHDDLLSPTALAECLEVLVDGLDAVYTDSDKVDEAGIRSESFFKPDWSPEYFRGVMFVGHLLCVRRDLALKIGGFDSRYDGVQDFEFLLRYSEQTQRIGHLSKILYHWRAVLGSVAASSDAKGDVGRLQRQAVQAHMDRLRLPAVAESGSNPHRVRIVPLRVKDQPMLSIIIPTKDAPDLLANCLGSIVAKTTYPNFEMICVDNETTDPRALDLMKRFPVKRLLSPGQFNFSKANNLGVCHAGGEFLVFMNNDIEVINDTWIDEMLYYARQDDVGAVGALLLYPDGTVQHAGVVLGCRGTADHVLRHVPADSDGYAGSLSTAREVSAVTAACMMIRRNTFERIGGFNEHYFTAYQDVDLCLELRELGLRNIFTPRARFFHLESASRGRYYDLVDRNLLLDRWEEKIAASDPYFNRNFDVEACDYSLKA